MWKLSTHLMPVIPTNKHCHVRVVVVATVGNHLFLYDFSLQAWCSVATLVLALFEIILQSFLCLRLYLFHKCRLIR